VPHVSRSSKQAALSVVEELDSMTLDPPWDSRTTETVGCPTFTPASCAT
jgi:hypothetical protein